MRSAMSSNRTGRRKPMATRAMANSGPSLVVPGASAWLKTQEGFSSLYQDAAGSMAASGNTTPVGQVKNLISGGVNSLQATAGKRPQIVTVGGKRMLEFDGSDDVLTMALAGDLPHTVFLVSTTITGNAGRGLGNLYDGGSKQWLMGACVDTGGPHAFFAEGFVGNNSGFFDVLAVDAVTQESGDHTRYFNGSELASTSDVRAGWGDALNIGAGDESSNFAKIYFGELIVYPRVLTTEELAAAHAEILEGWGITP